MSKLNSIIDKNIKHKQEIESQQASEEVKKRKEAFQQIQKMNLQAYLNRAKKVIEEKKIDEEREDLKAVIAK